MNRTLCLCLLAATLGTACGPPMVEASRRPYAQALTELRVARACLVPAPGMREGAEDAKAAVHEIDQAIDAIRREAVDDGQPLGVPCPRPAAARQQQLREALASLRRAEADCRREPDDNRFGTSLQARTLEHIHQAMRMAEQGILLGQG